MIRRPTHFPDSADVVEALHASPVMVAINATGAFTGLPAMLWAVPGASNTLLDYRLSYARAATIESIGHDPGKFCTAETARLMAESAYVKAVELAEDDREIIPFAPRLFGLGATASTATGREKKGADRFYVAVRTTDELWSFSAEFVKGLTRVEQGGICDTIALAVLAAAAGIEPYRLDYKDLLATDHLRHVFEDWYDVAPSVRKVEDLRFEELLSKPLFWPDGRCSAASELKPDRFAIFPGSFNPLHDGHCQMAKAVKTQTGKDTVFAICVEHPDKGRLGVDDIARRLRQFEWFAPALLSANDPLYIEKARRFPGTAFIVGVDTLLRIVDPKYYPATRPTGAEGESDLALTLAEFGALDTRFLVFDRLVDGTLTRLDDLELPASFRRLCTRIVGRWDVSSTEIRNARHMLGAVAQF